MMRFLSVFLLLLAAAGSMRAQSLARNCSFRMAKLKYGGGGDWYANPTSGKNLLAYVRSETRLPVCLDEDQVEPGSAQLFNYNFVYLTGHGNIVFSPAERQNLRAWLMGGGFLLMDDNYGLNKYARREIELLFPEYKLREIPFDHPIYRMQYAFPKGIPKIHQHDGKPAQAFGIEHEGRLVLVLTFETDLGDGWEDAPVHNNTEEQRRNALQMGANLMLYAASPRLQ